MIRRARTSSPEMMTFLMKFTKDKVSNKYSDCRHIFPGVWTIRGERMSKRRIFCAWRSPIPGENLISGILTYVDP